ncbi:GEM-like protein 4 [Macadamia integrifolia]|uniref:GEM-like protein 4 n=1 Tax=Macadamia integrifolia TaxID=60698 RepID=UPI001C4E4479|nr:GEM-like protein 4 [Macadamia integrifolia]
MKNHIRDNVIPIPESSVAYTVEKEAEKPTSEPESDNPYFHSSPFEGSATSKRGKMNTLIEWMNKFGKKADNFAHGVYEHVRLGSNMSATVKGKLSLGARILQRGGMQKVFKQLFRATEGEKLLKASQCHLSTTAGPVAGLLFISTEKVAFCSERSLKLTSPTGELIKTPYKVLIPLKKIKRVHQSENVKNPAQKYIQVVTVDSFEFWFMGFLNYQKAFKFLLQAISKS